MLKQNDGCDQIKHRHTTVILRVQKVHKKIARFAILHTVLMEQSTPRLSIIVYFLYDAMHHLLVDNKKDLDPSFANKEGRKRILLLLKDHRKV